MKQLSIAILLILCVRLTPAQEISLNFPHFAGAEYDFYIFQGTKNDTIQRGRIGDDGRLLLSILPRQGEEGYVGIARWLLKTGGGLEFAVNGNDFSVSCLEPIPSDQTIVYKDSPESEFLHGQFIRQQSLFQKIDALKMLEEAYRDESDNPLLRQVEEELKKQYLRFDNLTHETIHSPLYAAHYHRISNFYNGFPLYRIYSLDAAGQQERMNERRRFVEEELNMDVLYTAGLWNAVISQTFDLYEDKKDFASAMISNLKRTESPKVFKQLATDLVTICEQFDWPEAELMIIDYLVASERITQPNAILEMAFAMHKARVGTQAPPLHIAPVLFQKGGDGAMRSVMLVFHETGCGNCEYEIGEIKKHYSQLQEMGYRVITISADADEEIFRSTADHFPWEDKYCDLQGFEGADFKNYGVIGTPSYYLIDEEGVIQGRYARLQDTGIIK